MSKTAANGKVVEHAVASYDATDDPETHMPTEKLPKFRLKPKNERSTQVT